MTRVNKCMSFETRAATAYTCRRCRIAMPSSSTTASENIDGSGTAFALADPPNMALNEAMSSRSNVP